MSARPPPRHDGGGREADARDRASQHSGEGDQRADRAESILALQRSAGNAAVAAAMQARPAGGGARIARFPWSFGGVGPIVLTYKPPDPAVVREWTAELRRQAGNRMDKAFVKYTLAIQTVKAEMAEKKARSTLVEELFAVAFGMLAPGVAGLVISRFKDELRSVAEFALAQAPKAAEHAGMAVEELVDHFVAIDTPHAIEGVKSLMSELKQTPDPVAGGPGPEPSPSPPLGGEAPVGGPGRQMSVPELLIGFSEQFSVYLGKLDRALGTMDRAAVLGVWAAFDETRVTHDLYAAQIRDLVKQHEEIAEYASDDREGVFGDALDRRRIVMLEAYGVRRPALLKFHPGSAIAMKKSYWSFVKWVAPELAGTAMSAGAAQGFRPAWGGPRHEIGLVDVKAGEAFPKDNPFGSIPIQGHIDDPGSEGERIVELEIFGKVRLARVDVEGEGGRFLGWVAAKDEPFNRVKGERQPGGITRLDPAGLEDVPVYPPGDER